MRKTHEADLPPAASIRLLASAQKYGQPRPMTGEAHGHMGETAAVLPVNPPSFNAAKPLPMPQQTKLLGLEFGRFIASFLVFCFHFSYGFLNLRSDGQFLWIFRAGHAGVDYFFVLSGFIIYHVHRADLGRPDKLAGFALKRFIRLYPMYWLVFFTMLGLVLVSGSIGAHYDLSPGPRILDALLLPFDGNSLLGQSWTLRHEIVFYLVFALAIVNLRLGVGLFLVWQIACLTVGIVEVENLNGYLKPFLSVFNSGFAVGILAAWLSERVNFRRPGLVALGGIAGIILCMAIEAWIGHDVSANNLPLGEVASPLLYIGFAGIAVLGMTCWERTGRLPFRGLLTLLGGCSYVLYLIHGLLISILIRLFSMGPLAAIPAALSFTLMLAISVIAACMVHLYVEKPVIGWLRTHMLPRRAVT